MNPVVGVKDDFACQDGLNQKYKHILDFSDYQYSDGREKTLL